MEKFNRLNDLYFKKLLGSIFPKKMIGILDHNRQGEVFT